MSQRALYKTQSKNSGENFLGEKFFEINLIIMAQQDSTPAHKAKEVQDWWKANFPGFISAQKLPPYSPYPNPMNYSFWSILESRTCAMPHKSLESLRHSLPREWDLITLKEVRAICEKFFSRRRLCTKAKVGHFESS